MKHAILIFVGLYTAVLSNLVLAQDYQVPRTEWGAPDLRAVWKHASIIPFERPVELGDKRAYTEQEALAIERSEQRAVRR